MAKTIQSARSEVEQELAVRTARIENSVSRIRKNVAEPGVSVGRAIKSHPYSLLAGLAVAGAATALVLLSRRGDRDKKDPQRALADAYSERLAREVRSAETNGLSLEEALTRAVRANPPVMTAEPTNAPESYVGVIADRLAKTVTAMAFEFATNWLNERVESRKSRP